MRDAGKIIIGLIIFIALITLPVWYALADRSTIAEPELGVAAEEEHCVEPAPYMRANHMDLLNDWRQSVVRDGDRTYVSSDGQEYDMSLTGTCLECHANKAQFCDKCHDSAGVKPDCWSCHIVPEGD